MKHRTNRTIRQPASRVLRIANFSPGKRTAVRIKKCRTCGTANGQARPRIVDFQFYHPKARLVHLAGNFNGKTQERIRLQNLGGGAWVARLLLAPGQYTYHFLADGRWQPDPLATDCLLTDLGTFDSIAVVA